MNAELLETAKALPLSERIELAEALWESIQQAGYEPKLTPVQTAELDRRLTAHQQSPRDTVAWEVVKKGTKSRLAKRR
jgi:putative addiction module component (TIGR02574 family)